MLNFNKSDLDKTNVEEKDGVSTESDENVIKTVTREVAQTLPQEVPGDVVDNAEHDISKEVAEVIDPTTQKYLYIQPVSQEFKERLKKVVEDLVLVRLDIFNKKVEIVGKRELIREKIKFLDESKKVRIDRAEFERMEKSAQSYIQLLDGIIHELSGEIAYYGIFASDEKPPVDKVVVPLKASDRIEDYLELQMTGVKRYVKTVKRDIAISFSRYTFGFGEQLKHLSFVESYVKNKETQAPVKESAEKDQ